MTMMMTTMKINEDGVIVHKKHLMMLMRRHVSDRHLGRRLKRQASAGVTETLPPLSLLATVHHSPLSACPAGRIGR